MNENSKKIDKRLIEEYDELSISDRAGYKNLVAVLDYTKKTREMFRELQKETVIYKNQVLEQGKAIDLLRSQMQQLLIKVHQNGPTG
jgi:hypothetical protein